jgi:dephospho-CoA kinase
MAAGKSAVAARLRAHGITVIDSDALAREVVAPGSDGLAAVVAAFGPQAVRPDGALDRPALAAIVFGDDGARRRLEAITHPLIGARADALAAEAAARGERVVVRDIPLLVESGQAGGFDLVVTVAAPAALRLGRAVARGLTREQAEARLAAQAGDGERAAAADVVLDGGGSVAELEAQVDALVERIGRLAGARPERSAGARPGPRAAGGGDVGGPL